MMIFSKIAMGVALLGLGIAAPAMAMAKGKAAPSTARSAATQEQKNLALVLKFSEAAFNQHDADVAGPMLAENYVQHNPRVPDGRSGFLQFMKATASARPNFKSTILRSVASGDLVWTHVKIGDGSGKGDIVLVNIFRIAGGKIAEHWDVVQPVPETSANGNTMF